MAETEYQVMPKTVSEIVYLINDVTTPVEGNVFRGGVGQVFNLILRSMVDAGYTDVQVEMAKGHFKDLASRLDAMTADTKNIDVNWINKNLGKLDQSFMSEEFLQQITGNAPVNAVPADDSLITQQHTDKSITYSKMNTSGDYLPQTTDFKLLTTNRAGTVTDVYLIEGTIVKSLDANLQITGYTKPGGTSTNYYNGWRGAIRATKSELVEIRARYIDDRNITASGLQYIKDNIVLITDDVAVKLSDVKDGLPQTLAYEQGQILSTGLPANATMRVRTAKPVELKKGDRIELIDKADTRFALHDGVSNDFVQGGWMQEDLEIVADGDYLIMQSWSNDRTLAVADYEIFAENLVIHRGGNFAKVSDVRELKQIIDEIEIPEQNRLSNLKRSIIYRFPQGFRWQDNPLKGHIYTDGEGNFQVLGFDIAKYKPAGATYYVDKINGSDSASGATLASAFKTISKALSQSDVGEIKVASGYYQRNETLYSRVISKSVAITAIDGHEVELTSHSPSYFSKSGTLNNVYQATRGAMGSFVMDRKFKDGQDYVDYVKVSSAAEVDALAGSWAYVSGQLYIRTLDDREPDDDLILSASGYLLDVQGGGDFYLEGIKVIGGESPVRVQNTSSGLYPRFFAKNCDFYHSESVDNDVVMLQGVSLSIMENCRAMRGQKDGFNYHWRNGVIPYSIEINCEGFDNGNDSDDNDQGSTTHDGGSIIRINGAYFRNSGANIAEAALEGNPSTESLNLGCIGFESISPSPERAVNFDCYSGVNMWLDGCVGYGSEYNVKGAVKVRNPKFTGAIHPNGGTEPTYY